MSTQEKKALREALMEWLDILWRNHWHQFFEDEILHVSAFWERHGMIPCHPQAARISANWGG